MGSTDIQERTLGALVAERPARARVLERHGIDYCCHGQRSLAEAAVAAGLDAGDLAEELLSVVDPAGLEVDTMDPVALVDHIVRAHHRYLHDELPALRALADKVRDVHGEHHPELVEVRRLVHALADELEPHLADEEQVVFPAINELFPVISRQAGRRDPAGAPLTAPIRAMMVEHEVAGATLAALRAATRGHAVPADGCASYRSLYERLAHLEVDTFRHIHLENNVLFPQVLSLG